MTWSPWQKPDPAEATAAVVASVKNLEELLGELERLRAIVRDLAAEMPVAMLDSWRALGGYTMVSEECTLCGGVGKRQPSQEFSAHDPGCPWLRATQEAETTK